LQQHLDSHANQKTTNHESRWLFPGTRADITSPNRP
jgi:hypothetical protein